MNKSDIPHVLVAGIGGASLGTEVLKALNLAGGYHISGCDVSPLAFGHYAGLCARTFLIDVNDYASHLLDVCRKQRIDIVIPGGEEPARLIADVASLFAAERIAVTLNDPSVIRTLSDKRRCFEELKHLGFAIPVTVSLREPEADERAPVPCVVKPATNTGGSSFVFYAGEIEAVRLYATYLRRNKLDPIAQEYLPHKIGEFTIGVLSNLEREVVGSIALRRVFPAKLSIAAQGDNFLISSGYSQGFIEPNETICSVAEAIARAVKSTGPLNVQGRVSVNGDFLPFEINPRFSASTYLRAMAGFNEIDYYIRLLLSLPERAPLTVKRGWYLRSLSEVFVSPETLVP